MLNLQKIDVLFKDHRFFKRELNPKTCWTSISSPLQNEDGLSLGFCAKNLNPSLRIVGSQATDSLGVKQTPLFWGRSNRCWFLGTWGFFVGTPPTRKPIGTGIPPNHVAGELGFLRTRAFVVCLLWLSSGASGPPLAIHGRLGSWWEKNEWPVTSCQKEVSKENVFQKTRCVYYNGVPSYPKGSEEKRESGPQNGIKFRLRMYWRIAPDIYYPCSYVWWSFFKRTYNLGPKK